MLNWALVLSSLQVIYLQLLSKINLFVFLYFFQFFQLRIITCDWFSFSFIEVDWMWLNSIESADIGWPIWKKRNRFSIFSNEIHYISLILILFDWIRLNLIECDWICCHWLSRSEKQNRCFNIFKWSPWHFIDSHYFWLNWIESDWIRLNLLTSSV